MSVPLFSTQSVGLETTFNVVLLLGAKLDSFYGLNSLERMLLQACDLGELSQSRTHCYF